MEYTSKVCREVILSQDDFTKEIIWNIVIHNINISRATYKEAQAFKKSLLDDNDLPNLKVIIDLSLCEHIDSSFLGVIVLAIKNINCHGGEVKLVIPNPNNITLLNSTGLIRVFNIYNTRDEALDSFVYVPLELLK